MSCDLKQSKTSGPHYCGSVFDVIDYPWDLAIMHPPCTHTAVSGAAHFAAKRMDGRQQSGVSFFMALWRKSDHIPRVCIEQPISIMSKLFRAPDQIIQPYQFGADASKATCLWLRGLPRLKPTGFVEPRTGGLPLFGGDGGAARWENQTHSGQNKLPPSAERAALRAQTYHGIADAMASQWGRISECEAIQLNHFDEVSNV
jgi:hypothetical protein